MHLAPPGLPLDCRPEQPARRESIIATSSRPIDKYHRACPRPHPTSFPPLSHNPRPPLLLLCPILHPLSSTHPPVPHSQHKAACPKWPCTVDSTATSSTLLLLHPRRTGTRALRVPSVPPQTPTKTGPRSQILPSAVGYRTALLSATTVSAFVLPDATLGAFTTPTPRDGRCSAPPACRTAC